MKHVSFVVLVVASVVTASSQWISIRTVPVIAAQQGDFYPSLARGMGNLSIVIDDRLGAPFLNPAKGLFISEATVFASLARTSWSNESGSPVSSVFGSSAYMGSALNSIPIGGLFKSGNLFGGALFAYQGYKSERSRTATPIFFPRDRITDASPAISSDIGSNTFLFGLAGITTSDERIAVALSAGWADFGALDGVNLLYPGALDIRQSAKAWELKLGALARLPDGDRLELVAGRAVTEATHDVSYPDPRAPFGVVREPNRDETREWLLSGTYLRPVGERWRIGAALTVNWKDHPKIPNYALANIPRDPGTSIAYNFGAGARWSTEKTSWGFEYIYEPITTNTWAEAGEQQFPDRVLPPYFKTVENFFDFSNHILRVGHSSASKWEWLEYRLGAQLHFYSYDLRQINNLAGTKRDFSTDWLETTLTGGLTARLGHLEFLYTLQLILGNGMVGTATPRFVAPAEGGIIRTTFDFLPAPSGELVVDEITLVTHQLTFVYRLE